VLDFILLAAALWIAIWIARRPQVYFSVLDVLELLDQANPKTLLQLETELALLKKGRPSRSFLGLTLSMMHREGLVQDTIQQAENEYRSSYTLTWKGYQLRHELRQEDGDPPSFTIKPA
jgi:DNA-binding PadR family transcriptional regulator